MINLNTLYIFVVVSCFSISVLSANEEKRGWYWYAEIKKTEQLEERMELPPPPPLSDIMQMHPDDIAGLIDNYHKQFVWRPTEENAVNYLTIQDAARRKSLAVSAVQQIAIKTHPEYDASKDYPLNNVGNTTYLSNRKSEIEQRLWSENQNYGFIYFSQRSCPYCPTQTDILNLYSEKYGWQIKQIDIDERLDLATRFNITYAPAILLIKRDSPLWQPVSTGLATLPQLEESAYRSIRLLNNEIDPSQYFMLETDHGNAFDPALQKGIAR